jgi:hypothetical protein
VNGADYAIAVLWLLLCVRNTAAILPLFIHCLFMLCFFLFHSNFPIFCITSIALIQAAKININISSELRYAFLVLASVYWLGAIDELLYNQLYSYQGVYYDVMPYLVIALNAYIASLLFRDGGRNFVRIIDSLRRLVNHRLARL